MKHKRLQSQKYFLPIIVIGVVLVGSWYYSRIFRPTPLSVNLISGTTVCTQDVHTCPDGTQVGRSGPGCTFVCPNTGNVALRSSPNPANLTLGRDFKLDLNAYPNLTQLIAVQLELIYDPTKLEIFGLDHSPYLPNFLVNPIFSSGKFETTLAVAPNTGGVSTWGTLGKLNIKPLELGTHSIEFGPNTLVTTTDVSINSYQRDRGIQLKVFNPGDINYDKVVNLFDYTYFVLDYGKTGDSPADLNGSGKVDLFDYTIFVANYGKTSP